MKLGQVVQFNDGEFYILIERHRKAISGVVKEKLFELLPDNPNRYIEYKPFTKKRAGAATQVPFEDWRSLGTYRHNICKNYERKRFIVYQ